ncbi:MAG: hypothetical protein Q8P18_00420 [Pseudomonadota bacterium]|nr:hypothetical protein [Pseudomonadota bacterium]
MIPLPSLSDSLAPITAALDAHGHDERVNWMRGLGKKEQVALWKLADGRLVTTAELHGPEGEIVIHEGQNSLPLFSTFQKRVVKRGGVVQGYNHQSMGWLVGPGHFLVGEADAPHGGAHFSYLSVAASAPPEFPALQPNDTGLSTLVFAHMIDYLRRVSPHVIIGAAYKKGKATNDYFMLIRG